MWKVFIVKQWVEDVEYEGNVDADEALEELNGDEGKDEEKEKDEDKGKGKTKGKGKGGKK